MKPLTKQLLAAYICWVMLHIIFLVEGDNFFGYIDSNGYLGVVRKNFWPFGSDSLNCYDITEYIIYFLFPIAIYWVVRLIKESLPPTR